MSANPSKAGASSLDESIDRIDELVSFLLDDQLDGDHAELERMLAEDEHARRRYIELAQLHCDLSRYFAASRATPPAVEPGKSGIIPSVFGSGSPAPTADGLPS